MAKKTTSYNVITDFIFLKSLMSGQESMSSSEETQLRQIAS